MLFNTMRIFLLRKPTIRHSQSAYILTWNFPSVGLIYFYICVPTLTGWGQGVHANIRFSLCNALVVPLVMKNKAKTTWAYFRSNDIFSCEESKIIASWAALLDLCGMFQFIPLVTGTGWIASVLLLWLGAGKEKINGLSDKRSDQDSK
jgi:hypothetical protein